MKTVGVKNNAITYNYWIYVLTCLFVMRMAIKFGGRDPGTQWDVSSILFRLVVMFFFSTLGWFIGKKYHLHYSLVCGLGILIMVLTTFVWEFCAMLFFHFTFHLDLIWVAIWASFASCLVAGGAIFIISYPFQFLYFKLHQNFKKLE